MEAAPGRGGPEGTAAAALAGLAGLAPPPPGGAWREGEGSGASGPANEGGKRAYERWTLDEERRFFEALEAAGGTRAADCLGPIQVPALPPLPSPAPPSLSLPPSLPPRGSQASRTNRSSDPCRLPYPAPPRCAFARAPRRSERLGWDFPWR